MFCFENQDQQASQKTRFLNEGKVIFSFIIFFPFFMLNVFLFFGPCQGYSPLGHQKSMFRNKRVSNIFRSPVLILWAVSSPSLGKILWESSKNLSRRFEEDGQIHTWIGGTAVSPQNKREFQKVRGKNTTTQKGGRRKATPPKKGGERSTSKRKSRRSKPP